MPNNISLIAAIAPIVVGLLGLIGTRWVAGIQRTARANEERLKGYEAYDHTYANLRGDYDRVVRERDALRSERNDAVRERDTAQRRESIAVERWLQLKEAMDEGT